MDESREKELEKVADMAAEKILKKHLDRLNRRKEKWLHNTKKLMENYNALKEHSEKAITEILDTDLEEILCGQMSEENEKDLRITSINASKLRTSTYIAHLDVALRLLKSQYERMHKSRKYRALEMRYKEEKEYSIIAEKEKVDERTIYRDIDEALKDLSLFLYGINGLII